MPAQTPARARNPSGARPGAESGRRAPLAPLHERPHHQVPNNPAPRQQGTRVPRHLRRVPARLKKLASHSGKGASHPKDGGVAERLRAGGRRLSQLEMRRAAKAVREQQGPVVTTRAARGQRESERARARVRKFPFRTRLPTSRSSGSGLRSRKPPPLRPHPPALRRASLSARAASRISHCFAAAGLGGLSGRSRKSATDSTNIAAHRKTCVTADRPRTVGSEKDAAPLADRGFRGKGRGATEGEGSAHAPRAE